AAAGKGLLAVDDILVARRAVTGEVERLAKVVAVHHEEHPLDPGLSLQSLRAAVNAPAAVLDLLIEHGMKKQAFERTEDGAAWRRDTGPIPRPSGLDTQVLDSVARVGGPAGHHES